MSGLEPGVRVDVPASRRTARIVRFIGAGSEGEVFEVALEPGDASRAVKWYFPARADEAQRRRIEELIDRGSPDRRFLWPTEIVTRDGDPRFGYLMPLRDRSSVGLADLLTGKVDVPFSTICTLGMELAGSFLALHNEGLCYRDISFGNVFFDPHTGSPLICDNDNVGVDGASPAAVLGTRRFMAPEIVRREAAPSTNTDLYSLSVLLFYLLMVGHPLVGRRESEFAIWDEQAESVLFGHQPIFVFDPDDASNAPDPAHHAAVLTNWRLYPEQIKRLFVQAFTVGLTDANNGRVRESVWRSALAQLRDVVMRCPACSKQSFWQPDAPTRTCWSCDRPLPEPVRLEIGGRPVVLDRDTIVSGHHIHLDYDFTSTVGRVTAHPGHADRWGLRNESAWPWKVTLPSGDEVVAEPGRAVGLLPGTRLQIGPATAVIAC